MFLSLNYQNCLGFNYFAIVGNTTEANLKSDLFRPKPMYR